MRANLPIAIAMALMANGFGVSSAQVILFPTDDAYVEENDPDGVNNGAALNARTELDNNRNDIIYLRFDISEISDPIRSASLNLSWFRDKNVDHLELLYYGLNETADGEAEWTEFELAYENAPGLIPDGQPTIEEFEEGHTLEELQDLDVENLTFLGRRGLLEFADDDNIEGETVSFEEDSTVDFLRSDSDGLVTFMVLRDWDNSGTQMRFASKEAFDLETILGEDDEQFAPSLAIDLGSSLPGDFDADGILDVDDVDALTSESASRENDPFFDLDSNGVVNKNDVSTWAKDLANTWIGDANIDGEFNSGDFVQVFQAGRFEQGLDAVWSDGDWDGSGRFDSGDFVAAFTDGGFEKGPRGIAIPIPEPAALPLSVMTLALLAIYQRSSRAAGEQAARSDESCSASLDE